MRPNSLVQTSERLLGDGVSSNVGEVRRIGGLPGRNLQKVDKPYYGVAPVVVVGEDS
jgi:hypothetical protein